jgi:hypothetical protein
MGRSPFFKLSDIELPGSRPICNELMNLKPGDHIQFTKLEYSGRITRQPSVYYGRPSGTKAPVLIVDSIDYEPEMSAYGIRFLVLRDANIEPDNHSITWVVSTDGYVREVEHYGIMYLIDEIKILS